MKLYLSIAALAVFLFLTATNFYYHSKYNEQRALTAAQSVTIAGLQLYVKQTESNYIVAVSAERDKNHALLNSEKRIEELEKLLEGDRCAGVRVPDAVNHRLRERANSLRNAAANTE